VVAPWNYPLSTPNSLVMSALLTGNTVVIKPSELTPRTGAGYHDLLASELPKGVFEIVQGAGPVGAALVGAEVDMVAFTGSIKTGQAIMRAAAGSMKRLVLELGGKDPMIILPGADLEAAADHAARESTRNSGQVCISVERIFVHESVADEFAGMLESRVRAQEVGDPLDPQTQIGPMANDAQRQHVLRQLEAAAAAGADIRVQGESRGPGFFLTPSLALNVSDDMDLAVDETFGPVVCVSSYGDEEEVVRRANATQYGLGASVWGPDGEQTERVAGQIEAGMIGINRGLSAAGGAPWVGAKMSGFGYSRSREGMRQFMQPRTFSRRKA
jgi:acyl-CoA reductase-like NAD-dependent aldehyde dehydrogenase